MTGFGAKRTSAMPVCEPDIVAIVFATNYFLCRCGNGGGSPATTVADCREWSRPVRSFEGRRVDNVTGQHRVMVMIGEIRR
jgi:hypothetical protein